MKLSQLSTGMMLMATLIVGLSTGAIPAQAQTGSETLRFESVSCDIFNLSKYAPDAVEGVDVECGYLLVPENRDNPDGDTIQLGVMIIKSTNPDPVPDPLVLTQGGPGGSGIDLFAGWASPSSEGGMALRADRDLIVFEQRGTLFSKPFLFCQEVFDLDLESMEKDVDTKEQGIAAYQACKQSLVAEGVDLAGFTSVENAADVADLAKVLGYDKINFYGVSYGTQLGQHIMKEHPEVLRAVILDGVVSLKINPNAGIPWSKSRSIRAMFQACEADPDCSKYYPDLEKVFFDTVDALNENPARVEITDPQTGKTYNSIFDGEALDSFTFELLYATSVIPLLPKMIYDASEGVFDVPKAFLPLLAFDRSMAEGMYLSVMCAEDFDFTVDDLNTTDAYPLFKEDEIENTEDILNICTAWGVPELGSSADEPVVSDIPTLLFSGHFDPVTPPPYAEQVAETLSAKYNYVFPSNGHGAFNDNMCANQIVSDFLANPNQQPDAGCLETDEPPAPEFITPANTLMAPGARRLSNLVQEINRNLSITIESGDSTQMAMIIAAGFKPLVQPTLILMVLLTFPFIWFLGWLVNKIRKVTPETHKLAHLGAWLGVLMSIAALVFAATQIIQFVGLLLGSGGMQGIVGISRSFAWSYVLPWLIAALSTGMLVAAVMAWIKGYWGILARLYYSLVTLLALVFTVMLANAGMMAVLFYKG